MSMIISKKYTNLHLEEAKEWSVVPTDDVIKIKDKKWKLALVDKSGFGMAVYIDIHDLIIVNDTTAKIIKEYYLEEHISGNGEEKTE